MNDASGLEPGKTATIFTERKVIELPARTEEFKLGTMLRRSWNLGGCISSTTPSFDEMFVLGRVTPELPVPERTVVVEKLFGSTTDHAVMERVGSGCLRVGFVDLYHLIDADEESPGLAIPIFGPTYFFARGLGHVTCLCELRRIDDGLRLHSHEITSRARAISGSVIYRESLVTG